MSAEKIAITGFCAEEIERARTEGAASLRGMGYEGTIDICPGMTEEEFCAQARACKKSAAGLRDSYDAVFCLRREEDERFPFCWIGNPHLRVIEIRKGSDEWIRELTDEIAFFLGLPEPLEIERKYLIGYPDLDALNADPYCARVEITQVYLEDGEGSFRIRKRGERGDYVYYLTRKKQISPMIRIEEEERITEAEYLEYIEKAGQPLKAISKDRYCLLYGNRYFEIDVFPFWSDRALMEIELKSEDETVILPAQIDVIREVTEEKQYRNKALADMLAGLRPMI